jgi:hypothetical protein
MPGISLLDAQQIYSNNGLRTQYGLILPAGSRVAAYVRSTGVQSGDDSFLATNLVQKLADALPRVRPGFGDFVIVLPGHKEDVTDAVTFSTALPPGVKIIGVGRGSNMPTFTWTSASAQLNISQNDVLISGMRFLLAGTPANPVNAAQAINISANDCGFTFNEVELGNTVANATIGVGITGTAARFDVSGNAMRGWGAAPASASIVVNTTGFDGIVSQNRIFAGAATTTGNIAVIGSAQRLAIDDNEILNITPASVAGISYANILITGVCAGNRIAVAAPGAVVPGVTGITVGGLNNLTAFFNNFAVNDPNKSGFLVPAVDT